MLITQVHVRWLGRWLVCGTLLFSLLQAAPAQAQLELEELSMLDYGLLGLGSGAAIGASTGYLLERDGSWTGTNTRNFLLATSIGAVGGAGVGLLVGLLDQASANPGFGFLVLRNMGVGAVLGGLVGAATGSIIWIARDNGSGRDALTGASIGALIGVGAGLIFGLVEGAQYAARGRDDRTTRRVRADKPRVRFDIATLMQNEQLIVVPGLRGQF